MDNVKEEREKRQLEHLQALDTKGRKFSVSWGWFAAPHTTNAEPLEHVLLGACEFKAKDVDTAKQSAKAIAKLKSDMVASAMECNSNMHRWSPIHEVEHSARPAAIYQKSKGRVCLAQTELGYTMYFVHGIGCEKTIVYISLSFYLPPKKQSVIDIPQEESNDSSREE